VPGMIKRQCHAGRRNCGGGGGDNDGGVLIYSPPQVGIIRVHDAVARTAVVDTKLQTLEASLRPIAGSLHSVHEGYFRSTS
jgi:hypothetical protein